MNSLRNNSQIKLNSKDDIEFQCLEWLGTNEFSREMDMTTKRNKSVYKHVVKLYGVTKEGYSVSVNNTEFKPYFFIKVSEHFTDLHKVKLFNAIKNKLKENARKNKQYNSYADDIIALNFVKKKEFYGFTNNKLFKFIKITFHNSIVMSKVTYIIKEGLVIPSINKMKIKFKIYESNITPFIRFIHTKEVKASGWVKIPSGKYTINRGNDKTSMCQIDIDTHYDSIEPVENNSIAPMLIASFDIECSSSHGDFPLAKKNYKKLGYELYDKYKKVALKTTSSQLDCINTSIVSAFTKSPKLNIDDISYVFTLDDEQPHQKSITTVTSSIHSVLHTDENYKLLAVELLRYFFQSDKNDIQAFQSSYKSHIIKIINDSFSTGAKDNTLIKTIYTKTDKKPSQRIIGEVSIKALKQIYLLFKKIKKLFPKDEFEINNDTINDIISIYLVHYTESNQQKMTAIIDDYDFDEEYAKNITNDISLCINMLYSYFNEQFPEIDSGRDTYCKRIITILDTQFPQVDGDKVIQIGTTIQKYGEPECYLKHIISLKSCSPIEGAVVEWYDTEKEVLLAWTKFIQALDPDIITGYNIFGFDFSFMWDRAEELNSYYPDENVLERFRKLGRIKYTTKENENVIKNSRLEVKKLASSALGDNTLKYISMEGRIVMDLFKIVQKDFNLVSYKLDYVAETFINDKIKNIDGDKMTINGVDTLKVGHFITIHYGNDKKYKDKKIKIVDIDYGSNTVTLNEPIDTSILEHKPKWTLAKDDVSPHDIFRLQEGDADDRCIVAKYCIQDCVLVNNLIDKLKIITNNIGMSNVCSVPLSYLFLRGQGVKIFSLVSQQCRNEGFLIPLIKYEKEEIGETHATTGNQENMFEYGEDDTIEVIDNDDGYEGAIVLKPKPGIYLDTPVTVLDYASLYPSSMISENLSHDSIILESNTESAKYLGETGIEELKKIGYGYEDIQHDVYKWIDPKKKSKGKQKCGVKICRFVQPLDGTKSVIPNKLRELLKARKNTRKLIKFKTLEFNDTNIKSKSGLLEEDGETYVVIQVNGSKEIVEKSCVKSIKDTYSEFEKSVFDGLQLAFKMTANSLYGQLGAATSQIYLKDIAASTTATGRKLLYLAKEKVEEHFDGADVVYGDTDSIFINFNPKDSNGKIIKNKDGLIKSIEMGVQAQEYIQPFLKPPHKLEYEKTFWPFILFSKKRYIGNKYEFKTGQTDYDVTSMGVVSKRRDNANIVKHVYVGVIDILMNQKNLELSIQFLRTELFKLLDGKFGMDMLVVTKSLRGYYKNPGQIAHKVLADRMGMRDPGNKPSSNDRIPYAYIEVKENKFTSVLQGDRIEHPDYIKENGLKPDYKFYITNQIMKPVGQIYSLIVEKLDGFKYPEDYYDKKYKSLLNTMTPFKARNKINDIRFKDACEIVFGDVLRVANNRKNKSREITDFFKAR